MSGDLIFGFETVSMFFNQMGIVAIVDREGKYLYVSDAYPKVLNYKKQSVTEKTLKEFAHLWTKTAAYRKCHDIKTVPYFSVG